jgi:hypothetical protein
MSRASLALAAFAVLVSGCSKDPAAKRRDREQEMTEYMSSAKGRADLAKARADGQRRFGSKEAGSGVAARWAVAEGTWKGTLRDGRRIEMGVSRDGGGSIEILDAEGRSVAHASTSASLVGDTLQGTVTSPPTALSGWSKWSLSQSEVGAALGDAKGETVRVSRS